MTAYEEWERGHHRNSIKGEKNMETDEKTMKAKNEKAKITAQKEALEKQARFYDMVAEAITGEAIEEALKKIDNKVWNKRTKEILQNTNPFLYFDNYAETLVFSMEKEYIYRNNKEAVTTAKEIASTKYTIYAAEGCLLCGMEEVTEENINNLKKLPEIAVPYTRTIKTPDLEYWIFYFHSSELFKVGERFKADDFRKMAAERATQMKAKAEAVRKDLKDFAIREKQYKKLLETANEYATVTSAYEEITGHKKAKF